jgi:hypothetical protein
MHKLLGSALVLVLLALLCPPAHAQGSVAYDPKLLSFYGAPTGVCEDYQLAINRFTGALYTCKGRAWVSAVVTNLTSTLSITGGLVVTGDGTPNVSFNSGIFANTSFGFEFQSTPTILSNDGVGNSQLLLGSTNFRYVPATTGGNFGVGSTGVEWRISSDTGVLQQYKSVNTAGNGQAVIRASINQTGEVTGNSGTLTLVTPANSNSVYRLSIYTTVSTGVATSTIQWTASYTDVTGAATTIGTSINGAITGTKLGESFVIESQSGVAITLATATANSPKYKYYVRLEEL